LEDAVFAFAGVDEEPDFVDEFFEGYAFGDTLLAAAGFGAFPVGLFADVADGFFTVAVAFYGGVCSAGFGWVYWLDGAAHFAGFAAAFVSLPCWAGAAWCFAAVVGVVGGGAGFAGFSVSAVAFPGCVGSAGCELFWCGCAGFAGFVFGGVAAAGCPGPARG
jgi:hypothetical protein